MEKITQLLEKLKAEVDRFNDDHTGFEETIEEVRAGLCDAEMYLDDISHELNGDGFCEECGKWYTSPSPIGVDECFLCPECLQEIEQELWQEQYQSDSIPYDEL